MRTSFAGVAALLFLIVAGCDQKKSDPTEAPTTPPALPYRPATAAEVFALRSRCVELGEKVLKDDVHGPALAVEMASYYNARTNRCYVELYATKIDDPFRFHHETLYDGQTKEILAFAENEGGKKRGSVFAHNDNAHRQKNTEWYARAAEYMGRQMEDDRSN